MDKLRDYDVHFIGLKNGKHNLIYHLDDNFIKMFDNPPFSHLDLTVRVELDKKDRFFILHNEVDGTVEVPCDRCGEPFDYELLFDFDIILKLKDVENSELSDDDVVFLSSTATSFNLANLFYDYIVINIPMQVFHPDNKDGSSTCNPEILKKLEENSKKEKEIDPRWENLLKLKNKN